MDQSNVALQVVNALYKRNRANTDAIHAGMLADDVAPKFPDVPVAFILLIATRVLAIFYEPLTLSDVEGSNLKPIEKAEVCDYLAGAYRSEVEALQSMPLHRH